MRLLVPLLVLVGCSGVPTRELPPVYTLNPDRPAEVAPATDALADCVGVQTAPYAIELSCLDATVINAIGLNLSTAPLELVDSCDRVSKRVMEDVPLVEGPDLQLPHPSLTWRTAQDGSPAAETLVVCSPYREGGLLYTTASAFAGALPEGLVESIAWDGVPAPLVTSPWIDDIPFLGRVLPRRGGCRLLGAQNLSCAPNGQMSWERYSSVERAQASEDRKVAELTARGAEVQSDERVPCTFEGEITECRRVVARAPISKLLTLGASNVLVAYYATGEVRGQAAQAVCSFYEDQAPEGGLAYLCREAFTIPGVPLIGEEDIIGRTPTEEEPDEEEVEDGGE